MLPLVKRLLAINNLVQMMELEEDVAHEEMIISHLRKRKNTHNENECNSRCMWKKICIWLSKTKSSSGEKAQYECAKDSLLKFVKVEKVLDLNTSSEISDANEEEELKTVEINNDSLNNSNFDTELIPIRDENADVDNLLADDSGFELLNDPGKWPKNITDRIRLYLVKNIPPQVRDINFPINAQGRKFNPLHYDRVLPNVERVNRSWLLYSECKNKVILIGDTCEKFFSRRISGS
ncbi:hypothetical protein CBL_10026 [Carabus blaptoides fortunei]